LDLDSPIAFTNSKKSLERCDPLILGSLSNWKGTENDICLSGLRIHATVPLLFKPVRVEEEYFSILRDCFWCVDKNGVRLLL
jgi:hypothetical protein